MPEATSWIEVAAPLQEAAEAKKCWACGCLHGALAAIERVLPPGPRPEELAAALEAVGARLTPVRYDCLGCDVCHPALALDALARAVPDVAVAVRCPTETPAGRAGWPPLPGAYTVLRYRAPVAVCTLTDSALAAAVAREAGPGVGIVGTLQTENLGIERLITNVLGDPHLRFLVVCGPDSRQAIGHLPGASLVALAARGLDERGRILGAPGRRPVLRNLTREAVEHFRGTVEVVDLVGTVDPPRIMAAARRCAAADPGPASAFPPLPAVPVLAGSIPSRMVPDPAGYFVVFVDRRRECLSLEHYTTDGVLDALIEGGSAPELYAPAIERGLLTRLDHAAYLGQELARAEHALRAGAPYVQDAASERGPEPAAGPGCACEPSETG